MATRRSLKGYKGKMRPKRGSKTHKKRGKGGPKFLRVDSEKDIPKFEELLKKGPLTIIMVYLGWCGHCKRAEPTFKEVAQANYPGVNFAMLNGDLQDKTSIKEVKVEGVPEFVVSAPNRTTNTNTSVKVPISYDKNSVERLATVSSKAASLAGPVNVQNINADLTNSSGSPKPPPFIAINAPKAGAASSDEEEMQINAVSGMEDDTEDELEFGGETTFHEEEGTKLKMNSSLPPPSASLKPAGVKKAARLEPVLSLADEPTIVSPLSVTSPRAATANLAASLTGEVAKPVMKGGRITLPSTLGQPSKVTVDGYVLTPKKKKDGSVEFSFRLQYKNENGQRMSQNFTSTSPTDLVKQINDYKQAHGL